MMKRRKGRAPSDERMRSQRRAERECATGAARRVSCASAHRGSRTCTLYVLSSSSSSSAARHRTLEDSRDRHDLNQPEIHRVPRIREFYPTTFPNEYDKKKKKETKKEKSITDGDLESPSPSPRKKKKKKKKPKRNESKPPKRRFEGIG